MYAFAAQLRLEKFTLFWITADVLIPAGAQLMVGSGAHIYGGESAHQRRHTPWSPC